MELSPAWVSAGAAVSSVIVVVAGAVIKGAFNERDAQIGGLRSTAKTLFEKHDHVSADLQAYKLHVAETYVNEASLEKALGPINKSLENIQDELRERRKV